MTIASLHGQGIHLTTRLNTAEIQQAETRILVIDDHGLFRSGLCLFLEANFANALIIQAASLPEALALLGASPNLILLDVTLDGLNSLDRLPELEARYPASRIIVVSADESAETQRRATSSGAIAFVAKSSDGSQLIEVMMQNLSHAYSQPLATKPPLSLRQIEVLYFIHQGLSNKHIAQRLALSEFTVRGHVQAILKNLGVNSRTAAVFTALRSGVIK